MAEEKKVKIIPIIKQAFALALLDTQRAEWVNYGTSALISTMPVGDSDLISSLGSQTIKGCELLCDCCGKNSKILN